MMSTVICKLIGGFHINLGNAAITKLFEGERDHLIPSVTHELLDRDMFTIAGRMIGHSFLHDGPSFPGLSPTNMHTLFDGSLETTPVMIRDCPDLDIRDAVKMLDGDTELKELDHVHQLCLSWNLPAPNATNRKWLSQKILFHAVIEQTRLQINQLRKGLKETGLWPLLTHRRDVIPILFPRESEAQLTPQMILDCITWPLNVTVFFEGFREEEGDDSDIMDVDRVTAYLKTFIENASPVELKSLIKFWIGWELPTTEMKVEVVEAALPTSSTCFEKLRLPRHYTTYQTFHQDLCACISTSYSGFGCP
ncbi:G2/M phase-specific E3 ubiquitin-protein ligase-like [Paralichthys olivaceus]|uniref:G2/M phase-specific E3 ubiquitin-protein ligase-like n=1 Tax=Paralichthys olivaceus TaxID=8255 RepID=UPI003751E799